MQSCSDSVIQRSKCFVKYPITVIHTITIYNIYNINKCNIKQITGFTTHWWNNSQRFQCTDWRAVSSTKLTTLPAWKYSFLSFLLERSYYYAIFFLLQIYTDFNALFPKSQKNTARHETIQTESTKVAHPFLFKCVLMSFLCPPK